MQCVQSTFCRIHYLALPGVLLVSTLGCNPPGKPNPANRPELPDQIKSFDRLFATNCAGCHGADGELGPAPPLRDPLFAAIIPEDDMLRAIREGRTGTPMPPFASEHGGSLTEEQIRILAEGIKTHWKSAGPLPKSLPEYALTVNLGEQISPRSPERGAEIFARACADCHGPSGEGKTIDGVTRHAINVSAFLSLISDQALRRIIITGRTDLGMPNFAEADGRPADFKPLTSAEIDDLVALLAAWRKADQASLVQTEP